MVLLQLVYYVSFSPLNPGEIRLVSAQRRGERYPSGAGKKGIRKHRNQGCKYCFRRGYSDETTMYAAVRRTRNDPGPARYSPLETLTRPSPTRGASMDMDAPRERPAMPAWKQEVNNVGFPLLDSTMRSQPAVRVLPRPRDPPTPRAANPAPSAYAVPRWPTGPDGDARVGRGGSLRTDHADRKVAPQQFLQRTADQALQSALQAERDLDDWHHDGKRKGDGYKNGVWGDPGPAAYGAPNMSFTRPRLGDLGGGSALSKFEYPRGGGRTAPVPLWKQEVNNVPFRKLPMSGALDASTGRSIARAAADPPTPRSGNPSTTDYAVKRWPAGPGEAGAQQTSIGTLAGTTPLLWWAKYKREMRADAAQRNVEVERYGGLARGGHLVEGNTGTGEDDDPAVVADRKARRRSQVDVQLQELRLHNRAKPSCRPVSRSNGVAAAVPVAGAAAVDGEGTADKGSKHPAGPESQALLLRPGDVPKGWKRGYSRALGAWYWYDVRHGSAARERQEQQLQQLQQQHGSQKSAVAVPHRDTTAYLASRRRDEQRARWEERREVVAMGESEGTAKGRRAKEPTKHIRREAHHGREWMSKYHAKKLRHQRELEDAAATGCGGSKVHRVNSTRARHERETGGSHLLYREEGATFQRGVLKKRRYARDVGRGALRAESKVQSPDRVASSPFLHLASHRLTKSGMRIPKQNTSCLPHSTLRSEAHHFLTWARDRRGPRAVAKGSPVRHRMLVKPAAEGPPVASTKEVRAALSKQITGYHERLRGVGGVGDDGVNTDKSRKRVHPSWEDGRAVGRFSEEGERLPVEEPANSKTGEAGESGEAGAGEDYEEREAIQVAGQGGTAGTAAATAALQGVTNRIENAVVESIVVVEQREEDELARQKLNAPKVLAEEQRALRDYIRPGDRVLHRLPTGVVVEAVVVSAPTLASGLSLSSTKPVPENVGWTLRTRSGAPLLRCVRDADVYAWSPWNDNEDQSGGTPAGARPSVIATIRPLCICGKHGAHKPPCWGARTNPSKQRATTTKPRC